jgi:hypothetical protein
MWYFSLPQGSITNWNDFEISFMKKFGEDKTPTTLVLEFSRIKMNPKEKIKDFNQIFLTLMNKILEDSRPADNVIIEFYTTTLPSSIAIFVKRAGKNTLAETFEETLDVEKK